MASRFILARIVGAVIIGGAAVGTAGPAAADDPPNGIYTYLQPGVPQATWSIYPTCVPAGCVLHISSITSPHLGPNSSDPGYSGDARPVNGRWTLQVTTPDAVTCPDGSKAPITINYAFDAATLAGDRTVLRGIACGLKPSVDRQPFTLRYDSPLPIPIILDPLNQIPDLW